MAHPRRADLQGLGGGAAWKLRQCTGEHALTSAVGRASDFGAEADDAAAASCAGTHDIGKGLRVTVYVLQRGKAEAYGSPISSGARPKFRVREGSTALRQGSANEKRKRSLRDQLVRDGVLVEHASDGELFAFARDYDFSSASAAGDVINDGNLSAPERWRNVETGISLKADLETTVLPDPPAIVPALNVPAGGASIFEIGKAYTREDVADAIGLSPEQRAGGAWMTGYSRWSDEIFVFCNVETAGRTGHDYPNQWLGKDLVWFGNARSAADQPLVRAMVSGDLPVHVFWRGAGRSPFTYAGAAKALDVRLSTPVEIRWGFDAAGSIPPVAPVFHRGPPPYEGEISGFRTDGPTSLYLMRLTGSLDSFFPELETGRHVVKVGISNDTSRRLSQLNVGFSPGAHVSWTLIDRVDYPNSDAAYQAEGRILDRLRLGSRWIGGEFAVVDDADLHAVLQAEAAAAAPVHAAPTKMLPTG